MVEAKTDKKLLRLINYNGNGTIYHLQMENFVSIFLEWTVNLNEITSVAIDIKYTVALFLVF